MRQYRNYNHCYYNTISEGIIDTALKSIMDFGKSAVPKVKKFVLKTASSEQHAALNTARANSKSAAENFQKVKDMQYRKNTDTYKKAEAALQQAETAEKEAAKAVAKRNKEIITSYRNAKGKAANIYNNVKSGMEKTGKFVTDHPVISATIAGAGITAASSNNDEKKQKQQNENIQQISNKLIKKAVFNRKSDKRDRNK